MTWRLLLPAAGVATTLILWWAAAAAAGLPAFLLPTPGDVAAALTGHHSYLAGQAGITVGHTLGGLGSGAAAAVAAALLLSGIGWLRATVLPLLVGLQAVPKVALAPLLIIWLGYGPASKITLVALLCFFPVLLSALAGLRATPVEVVEYARSLNTGHIATFVRLRIPYALPQLFTGLKVAAALALIGAVVAQMTSPTVGLGAVIMRSSQAADTPLAFAAITLLAGIGISLHYSIAAGQRWLIPWARHTTA